MNTRAHHRSIQLPVRPNQNARKERIPRHIGIIPDGNRRWAVQRGLRPGDGYAAGIEPGLQLLRACRDLGVREATVYGFTRDNTRRPKEQVGAFQRACVAFVQRASALGVSLRMFGETNSPMFPKELLSWSRPSPRNGEMRVNFLVNYGWDWDLRTGWRAAQSRVSCKQNFLHELATADISRIDLIVRWGGRRRLSGFPPIQSVYADFFVLDALWPDFELRDLDAALQWYATQDVTLGG